MFNESGASTGSGDSIGTITGTSTSSVSNTASDADIQAYRQKISNIIKSSYKALSDSARANKCVVNFVIDAGGNISKLELKYSSGMDEVDKAVEKAISSKAPYPAPPNTKSGQMSMKVTVDGGELTIDEP
jgi:TonB family protein